MIHFVGALLAFSLSNHFLFLVKLSYIREISLVLWLEHYSMSCGLVAFCEILKYILALFAAWTLEVPCQWVPCLEIMAKEQKNLI